MQFSPANTSDTSRRTTTTACTSVPRRRTSCRPSALADLILEDGNNTVGILALNDAYGTGLAENTRNNLVDGGLGEEDVVKQVIYDPKAANFDAEVQQMVDLNPDAIVVIGFEESVADHPESQRRGHRPEALSRALDQRGDPVTDPVARPAVARHRRGAGPLCCRGGVPERGAARRSGAANAGRRRVAADAHGARTGRPERSRRGARSRVPGYWALARVPR